MKVRRRRSHEAKNIVVATGSEVATPLPRAVEIGSRKTVVSSTGALDTWAPSPLKKLAVIGGGVIGARMGDRSNAASVSQVTVLELPRPHTVRALTPRCRKNLQRILRTRALNFHHGCSRCSRST